MYGTGPLGAGLRRKITAPELRARKVSAGFLAEPIVMVTAYDFTMARLMDEGGVDAILVGDSLGMVVQGQPNTLSVTLEEIAYHARAVGRAAQHAHVVGDMPFMSYQVSPERALESAGRLVKEGGVESVKLEGGEELAEHVRKIVRAGVPVMGHVGLLPQSVHAMGGFKVQGRGEQAADRIIRDARALEEAGAFAIVIEGVPPDVGDAVTKAVSVPTIGIGAGPSCDGQVLVSTDLLGLSLGPSPKFVKRFAELGQAVVGAVAEYTRQVRAHEFPAAEHTYKPNQPRESGQTLVETNVVPLSAARRNG